MGEWKFDRNSKQKLHSLPRYNNEHHPHKFPKLRYTKNPRQSIDRNTTTSHPSFNRMLGKNENLLWVAHNYRLDGYSRVSLYVVLIKYLMIFSIVNINQTGADSFIGCLVIPDWNRQRQWQNRNDLRLGTQTQTHMHARSLRIYRTYVTKLENKRLI